MFGVTTPCVTHAAETLDGLGYEVLTFHMTGTGGRSMESLTGVASSAGCSTRRRRSCATSSSAASSAPEPDRLTAAGTAGVPQVVSLGALDMVNFGPRETVPAAVRGAQPVRAQRAGHAHAHDARGERQLGEEVARKLSAATGPVALFVPLGGISMIATPGGPFYDARGRRGPVRGRARERRANVELVELDSDINDPAFADAMVAKLHGYLGGAA